MATFTPRHLEGREDGDSLATPRRSVGSADFQDVAEDSTLEPMTPATSTDAFTPRKSRTPPSSGDMVEASPVKAPSAEAASPEACVSPKTPSAVGVTDPGTEEAPMMAQAGGRTKIQDALMAAKAKVLMVVLLTQETLASASISSAKQGVVRVSSDVWEATANARATATAYATVAQAKVADAYDGARAATKKTVDKVTTAAQGAKTQVLCRVSATKAKATETASRAKTTALGYVPEPVKTRVSQATQFIESSLTKAAAKKQEAQAAGAAYASAMKARVEEAARRAQETALSYVPDPVKAKTALVYERAVAASTSITDYAQAKVELAKANTAEATKYAKAKTSEATDYAKTKSSEVSVRVQGIAADPKYQVTAASAAGGAVAMGTTGGAVGAVSGGLVGAAAGVVPAVFTFGLSIPIGAFLGSGAGLCVGTAVGGATGLVGGGAAGYAGYTKRGEISAGASDIRAKAAGCAEKMADTAGTSKELVKTKAHATVEYARGKAAALKETASVSKAYLRARIVGGTGPTDAGSD